jgi:hypothetical protein
MPRFGGNLHGHIFIQHMSTGCECTVIIYVVESDAPSTVDLNPFRYLHHQRLLFDDSFNGKISFPLLRLLGAIRQGAGIDEAFLPYPSSFIISFKPPASSGYVGQRTLGQYSKLFIYYVTRNHRCHEKLFIRASTWRV